MDNEKIIRKKVFVYGAVQGVGFRDWLGKK